jgi:tetratricopeptide (TPR) repeat protein
MRAHAEAAARLGAGLPARERALLQAQMLQAQNEYARACTVIAPLVARDSTDIEALMTFGECAYHDATVDVSPTDSTTGTFRWSWNASLRSFRRVIELDPSQHVAFEHILDILSAVGRGGRPAGRPVTGPVGFFATSLRAGDSLSLVPVSTAGAATAYFAQRERAEQSKPRIASLQEARRIAEAWVDSDTSSVRAHSALGRVKQAQGDLTGADAEFRRVPLTVGTENAVAFRNWMEVKAKLGQGVQARALFDSLVKSVPDAPGLMLFRGGMALMFGKIARFENAAVVTATPLGPRAIAYAHEIGPAVLGVPRPTFAAAEAAWAAEVAADTSCDAECRLLRLTAGLGYALRAPRPTWPVVLSKPVNDGRLNPAVALYQRDTAALRRAATKLESDARRRTASGATEGGWALIAADAYLLLGDSAAALRAVRFSVDSSMPIMPIGSAVAPLLLPRASIATPPLWPRAMLLRADLAAAAGIRDEAKEWYDRVLSLWADADPELQPEVARIRGARAKLGP